VLRPLVEVSLVGKVPMEQKPFALVDSGSEHTLAAPWVARAIQVDIDSASRTMPLGIGGETVTVSFLDVRLRLHPPGGSLNQFVEWGAEVGFVHHWRPSWSVLLGQVGFLDRFTVTMHRGAQTLVVEEWSEFDRRFGVRVEEAEERRQRFTP